MKQIDVKAALGYMPADDMIRRYCMATGLPAETALVQFREVLKFLVLTATFQAMRSGERCSPPLQLDPMWHHFLIDDTEVYAAYCDRYLGSFVHHRTGGVRPWDELLPLAHDLGIALDTKYWRKLAEGGAFAQCG